MKIERYLPEDQYQAAINAANPSAANPFLTAADFGSIGATINFPLGAVVDNGTANSGLITDVNTLTYSISGNGINSNKASYFQFVVPQGYGGSSTFNILLKRVVGNPIFVVTAFVNGSPDATINAANINPSALNVLELITHSFGTPLVPGDSIGITLSFLGGNNNDLLIKGLFVNYNFDVI